MRFLALVTDYDGTLARDGQVSPETSVALRQLKETGRKLILVSGRLLSELMAIFPEHSIFDMIVAENGAVLWNCNTHTETLLATPPPVGFSEELRRRGAYPVTEGKVIVATWQPHEITAIQMIRDHGLEMQVIFNKGAVMVLPSGVNKASGLQAALEVLNLSSHNIITIGDAENDHALLELGEASVAVNNALPRLKEKADLVTAGQDGEGVKEVIEALIYNDFKIIWPKLERHDLVIGKLSSNVFMRIPAYGAGILIAGTSGGGKSTLAATFIEKLAEQHYQFCIIDPEGDFSDTEKAVILGDANHIPTPHEIMKALDHPQHNCVVNLIGMSLEDRPDFFEKLFSEILHFRGKTGRPHWLIIDEAHHVLPGSRDHIVGARPEQICGMLLITYEPEHLSKSILKGIDLLLVIGKDPRGTMDLFCETVEDTGPLLEDGPLDKGQALAWWRNPRSEPFKFHSFLPSMPRHRHIRKYAQGDVKSGAFIFTGPHNCLKLRAQNLFTFLQMGEGVDDLTWNFHLYRRDYENWFRLIIKDDTLADFTRDLASDKSKTAEETRKALSEEIQRRYIAPG